MAHQVISVNRKKFAAGLFWQPVGAGFTPRGFARHLASTVDKKLNLFIEYRAMVGLGARRMGLRAGMPSAAAAVMDALTEYSSFLAVFDAGDVYYLVAVRNGIILADQVFNNADDARDEYFKLSEIPDWGALIAPGQWGMPRAVERTLPELFSTMGYRDLLRPISHFRTGMFSLVLVAIFCLVIFSIFRQSFVQVFSPRPNIAQIDPELAAEYKRQIEEKNRELDAQFNMPTPPEPAPLIVPYDYLPDPIARAKLCYQAIGFLMQPITGWNQIVAECGETHASARLRRSFGTIGDFYAIATEKMPHIFVQEQTEDLIQVRATLPELKTRASQDERDADTVLRDVTTLFQMVDEQVSTQIVTDFVTNGEQTLQLNVVEIGASSKMIPEQFMQIFNEFGGVYMTRCTWDAGTRTWNYEVIIYAK